MTNQPNTPGRGEQRDPDGSGDTPAREPLPGRAILPEPRRLPEWYYDQPDLPHVVLKELDFHVRYEQIRERDGLPPHDSPADLARRVRGQAMRTFLISSLNGWRLSEAAITDDGVIRYRHSRDHRVLRFLPDTAAGVLIVRPDVQLTAPTYRVTGPAGERYLWSRHALLGAVGVCLRPGPIDWPDGWAHLLPNGQVRFADRRFPWAPYEEWTAKPIAKPVDLGEPCADCRHFRIDHNQGAPWGRVRRDRTDCKTWSAEPTC
ncbi:hypothetical protein [Streptomyces sp. NPDC058595]|uniref:hypothetical protein n=1 Tax=Streptomyces sp. NPDC058595 TaxID=3346550 RepID=UPI003666000C